MFEDLKRNAIGRSSKPGERLIRSWIVWIFALIAYVGLFCASAFVTLLPFEILKAAHARPPSKAYWIIVFLVLLGETSLLIKLILFARRIFKYNHEVNIDSLVGIAGIVLAILLISCLYISGNIPLQ